VFTQDKVLTEAAKEAARELHDAGIALAITSGRRGRNVSDDSRRNMMKQLSTLTTATVLLLFLGLGLSAGEALGQAKVKISKEQLVGAWANVSVQVERSDGNKVETFGPNLKGVFIFTADDRYALVLTRPDLPKIASNDRLKGTPEEYQAVVQGSVAHFGTYSVNEAEGTYTLHVESSTFPNYNGTDQIRIVTSLSRDEMKVTNPSPTTPTKAYVVYKRL
jgi:Lipocalin-like domain